MVANSKPKRLGERINECQATFSPTSFDWGASLECGGLAPLCYRSHLVEYQSGVKPPHSKAGLNSLDTAARAPYTQSTNEQRSFPQTGPRVEPARRNHDSRWVDDRIGDFYRFRRIVAAGGFAGMAPGRLGSRGR